MAFRGELLFSGRVIIFDLFTVLYVHPEDVNIMFMFCVYTHESLPIQYEVTIWASDPRDVGLMFKQKSPTIFNPKQPVLNGCLVKQPFSK